MNWLFESLNIHQNFEHLTQSPKVEVRRPLIIEGVTSSVL